MIRYWAEQAFLGEHWAAKVKIEIDPQGIIREVEEDAPQTGQVLNGPLLPSMPNLHSHAFQRAMAGLAEKADGNDDFWTWRKEMYHLAQAITPELYLPLARYLYIEMLEAGYGAVAEFHYLHGEAPRVMCAALEQAAAETHIALTLLPVFYAHADFGGVPPQEGQKRFLLTLDQYAALFEDIKSPKGLSFHSLRAATIEEIQDLVPLASKKMPIHTHIAEQVKEVEASLAFSGQRPIAYLDGQVELDSQWCLIHATHADRSELKILAERRVVAGLCPSTEGNLGDGIFDALAYCKLGGRWGIGTDSHVTLDPAAELRNLEYNQRLSHKKRNLLHGPDRDVAKYLYAQSLTGGAQALGQKIGRIAPGYRADFFTLDPKDPMIGTARTEDLLGRAIFACKALPVKDVIAGGRQVVTNGRHFLREAAEKEFTTTMTKLRSFR